MTPAYLETLARLATLDIGQNQHFERLIAVTVKGGGVMAAEGRVFAWPGDASRHRAAASVNGG